jgi:tRNA G26 N,N-dimethylase Trm1
MVGVFNLVRYLLIKLLKMKKVIKLKESDIENIIKRVLKEQETDRYMFFSNLEQIHRQTGILLEKDPEMIHSILENGHDWAQDHIATAKESIDQVFDFLMNMEKGDGEQDIDDNSFDVM